MCSLAYCRRRAVRFAVEVDILVYPTSNSIVRAVQNLLADSSLLSELGSSTGSGHGLVVGWTRVRLALRLY